MLTPSMETGAFATIARNLAQGLLDHRVEVDVVYLKGPDPEQLGHMPDGVRLTRLGRHSSSSSWAIARHLRSRRPDALVSLGWIVNPSAVLAVALARTSTTLLLNEQSSLSYKSRIEHAASLRLRVLAPLARWVYPRAAAVTGASSAIVADLVEQIGLDPDVTPLHVIPNAVDAPAVRELATRYDAGRVTGPGPVFVNVARHARQKNLGLLLKSFRLFLDTGQLGTLVLVGSGPMTEELREIAMDLGVEHAVRFRGHLENPFPQVAAASAFVLSSEEEGFGLVLVEAMALGVPVVSTDCPGGPRDILRGGHDGILVPSDDPPAMAAAMSRLAVDAVLRERLAERGRARASDFDVGAVAREWLNRMAEHRSCTASSGDLTCPT